MAREPDAHNHDDHDHDHDHDNRYTNMQARVKALETVLTEKGLIDPVHKHMDHETVAYLIKGRLRLVIGGEEFIAEAGTSWIHPRGVEHFSEALEDCEQLEIKSPPRKTWTTE